MKSLIMWLWINLWIPLNGVRGQKSKFYTRAVTSHWYIYAVNPARNTPIFFRVARAAYGEETYLVLDFVLKFVRLHVIIWNMRWFQTKKFWVQKEMRDKLAL